MAAVMIGVDPAKRSNTIEVIDGQENVLLAARFDNSREDYRRMLALVKRFPQRTWAVEGATGVGLNLAQRLVSDGERVLDVPSKLSTRVRAIDTGHGRKNDPTDAHAVAIVGLRTAGLREVSVDDEVVVMRLLSDRRRDLVRSRTQAVNRLHQVLMQLIPAGARKKLTAEKAKTLIKLVAPQLKESRPTPCPSGCDRALEYALITAPAARSPDMVKSLDAVAGRVLKA